MHELYLSVGSARNAQATLFPVSTNWYVETYFHIPITNAGLTSEVRVEFISTTTTLSLTKIELQLTLLSSTFLLIWHSIHYTSILLHDWLGYQFVSCNFSSLVKSNPWEDCEVEDCQSKQTTHPGSFLLVGRVHRLHLLGQSRHQMQFTRLSRISLSESFVILPPDAPLQSVDWMASHGSFLGSRFWRFPHASSTNESITSSAWVASASVNSYCSLQPLGMKRRRSWMTESTQPRIK